MRILLDHCVPKRLRHWLTNHNVKTTREMLWDRLRNGELLAEAAPHFDLLLTLDRNIKHQQNLNALPVSVVVLIAKSNKLHDVVPLLPAFDQALTTLQPRTLVEISSPSP